MARYAAKNLVAAGLCERVEIQVSYAIGVKEPVSIYVNSFGTGKLSDEKLAGVVKENFDFAPQAMIHHLKLRTAGFKNTAAYGHFGRKGVRFTWEETDKAKSLKKYL